MGNICDIKYKVIKFRTRHKLECNLEGTKGLVVVLGLNPSTADNDISNDDATVKYLKRKFNKIYKKMIIYNLFENYSTDSHFIARDTKTDFENPTVKKDLEDAVEIVVGWGTDKNFIAEKIAAINVLKRYADKIRCLSTDKKRPYHPSRLPNDAMVIPIEIADLENCLKIGAKVEKYYE